ncbi:hypothetical protein [Tenacibaculum sp. UWU-22]|uniref:hypothetical protein n=1 Tax=Tenacibaculum sp. UWU-22 TaxID=3234187 RepID=UPI0034DB4277
MEILELNLSDKIASVKLKIDNSKNDFISYNSLVLDTDNQWKRINNRAIVTAKK